MNAFRTTIVGLVAACAAASCRTTGDELAWLARAPGDFARVDVQVLRPAGAATMPAEDRARLVAVLERDFGAPVLEPTPGRFVVELHAPRELDLAPLCALLDELRGRGIGHVNPFLDVRGEVREGCVTVLATGQTFAFEGEPPGTSGAQGFVFRRDARCGVVLSWAY